MEQRERLMISFGLRDDGRQGVILVIPASAAVDVNGDKRPGIVLLPSQAREIAFNLLLHAESVSAGRVGESLFLPVAEGPPNPIQ